MSDENLRVVQAACDAFSRRDDRAMLELFDPNVVFTPLPDTPDLQSFHGHEGVVQAIEVLARGAWDDFSLEISHMRVFDDRVVASLRWWGRGRASGMQVENDIYALLTLREGKIVRWQFFPSQQQALDAADSG